MNKWEKAGGAIFGGIAVSVAIWMIGDHFALDKNSWAAWVQAIGSVAAIGGAVWIASEQRRLSEIAARKELLERNVSLCTRLRSITTEAAIIAGASLDLATNGFEVRRKRARLLPRIGSDLHYRMARLEADEIEPIRATVLFKLREVLGRFDRAVEVYLIEPVSLNNDEVEKFRDFKEDIDNVDSDAKIHLDVAERQLLSEFPETRLK